MKYTKETKTGKTINKEKTCKNPKDGRNTMSPQQKPKTSKKPWATLQHSKSPLAFSGQEPTPLASKLIEHSKFLSSLLPTPFPMNQTKW
jgi:hypothetical protein